MKPRFIVTIDTETFRVGGHILPFGNHHYADLPDGPFGVQKIIDICDRNRIKATFFVDVYMHRHYGERDVRDLCRRIDDAGHDVQLHAHTSWFPESQSGLIREFSLQRQLEIIAEGRDLLEKWTRISPVGFRAGAYGANLDTIRALKMSGFRIDSSYFPLHRNCELGRQLKTPPVNQPFYIEGILEIPVTTYWLLNVGSRLKNSKIDVNACSWPELNTIVTQLANHSVPYIVLFLHSFSFVNWDTNGENLTPKMKPLKRFEMLLKMIREDLNGEFATIREISEAPDVETADRLDFVPSVSPLHLIPRVLNRFFD